MTTLAKELQKDATSTEKETLKSILVKVGNVHVRIYRRERKKGDAVYSQFDVADYTSGRRKFISFADEMAARKKAHQIATKLAKLDGAALTLTGADAATYVRAQELLKPTGVPLELVAAQFAEVHEKLHGRSLVEAVNFFLKRQPVALPRKLVSDVVTEMLAAKEADGRSQVYRRDLSFRLGKFAEAFHCAIAEVSDAQINEWLRGLKGSARHRNNYRNAVRALFKFGESVGYTSKDHIDFDNVSRAKGTQGEIGIFTPAEMVKMLNTVQSNRRCMNGAELAALLLLGGFAGLRTAEIERQVWPDVMLDRGFIRVTGAKGNTAQKRLLPISDNLRKWLAIYGRKEGPCWDGGRTADAMARLAGLAGVAWKHNGLRHSFGSYRMAVLQDPAKTAYEMGNSPQMIVRHYRELVLPEEAKNWFSIEPTAPANVVTLPAAAVA